MSQSSSPPPDNNSGVVINQDGKIEYHIIDDDNNSNQQSESATADVKAPPIENELVPLDSTQSLSSLLEQLRYSRFIPYFILILIFIILLMGQQLYLDSLDEVEKTQSQTTQQSTVAKESPAVAEIKLIAKLLYDEEKLNLSVLKMFNEKWQDLDDASRQSLKGSFWFGRFSDLLQQKIESQQASVQIPQEKTNSVILGKFSDIGSDVIIAETAAIIGMPLPDDNQVHDTLANSTLAKNSDYSMDEISQAISTEIAKVEAEKVASTANNTITHKDKSTEPKSSHGFFESDANYLLGQYAATYEFGKTNRLLNYFSANKNYRKRLKSVFKKVFAKSSKRRIVFSDLQWTFNENFIVGKGTYQAKIKLKNNKGTRYVNADIKVKLKSKKEILKIATMDFYNVEVDLKKPPAIKKNKIKAKEKSKPNAKLNPAQKHKLASARKLTSKDRPTTAELQDVVSRFALAYESGNITELDNIFSKDIKTNDKSSLSSVKQDYADLFKKTTDRQLFIEELSWSIDNNSAKGVGKLSVLLISQDSNKISTQHGEIRIVAKKTNHKTMITGMYHEFEN